MNRIWNLMAGGVGSKTSKTQKAKIVYPYTQAFQLDDLCIGAAKGVVGFDQFPQADILNVKFRNGRVRVIYK